MPTIEVTQEQAAALARGENVTLSPPRNVEHFIAVNEYGSVFRVEKIGGRFARFMRVAQGTSIATSPIGEWLPVTATTQDLFAGPHYTLVPVEVKA